MPQTRQQLTLFLDQKEAQTIEEIRKKFNPVQYQLIKSHITLCREDEIEALAMVLDNLANLNTSIIEFEIGKPERFSEGKGVFIPVFDQQNEFKKLRNIVLNQVITHPRAHEAHITIMHPRNATCNDLIFKQILAYPIPHKISISKISLIEQELGKKWKVMKEFDLLSK